MSTTYVRAMEADAEAEALADALGRTQPDASSADLLPLNRVALRHRNGLPV